MITRSWFPVFMLCCLASLANAQALPRALVLQEPEGGAVTAKALSAAGVDAQVIPALPLPDLAAVRLVVLTNDVIVPDAEAAALAGFVRRGGGLLVMHTAKTPDAWWTAYRRVDSSPAGQPQLSPMWDIFPFTLVPPAEQMPRNHLGGMCNPFGPTRVGRQAADPLLAGVDLTKAPAWPQHAFMVPLTHPIVQGTNFFFSWNEDQLKSPLNANARAIAWGDDPEQRPLLFAGEYGAGHTAASAVPLLTPDFVASPACTPLLRNLVNWLTAGTPRPAPAAHPTWGIGVPWVVSDSLARQGFAVSEQANGAEGAVVFAVPTPEQAAELAAMVKAGKPVVVANPAALAVEPLRALAPLTTPPAPAPAASGAGTARVDDRTLLQQFHWQYAVDPHRVGEKDRWFADGMAQAPWRDRGWTADDLFVRPAQPATTGIEFNPTWKYQLEGALLDRRDFVEGWASPDYKDNDWPEAPRGKVPPFPKVLGQSTVTPAVVAGALWLRYTITVPDPAQAPAWLYVTPTPWLRNNVPSSWASVAIDGVPLTTPKPVSSLAPGKHLVAVRLWPVQRLEQWLNEHPWGNEFFAGDLRLLTTPFRYHAADNGAADRYFAADHPEWTSADPDWLPERTGWYQVQIKTDATTPNWRITDNAAPTETTVWVDGVQQGKVPLTLDLAALAPGQHTVTLLKTRAGGWRFDYPFRAWQRTQFTLPADAPWNALSVERNTDCRIYVNGQRVSGGMAGIYPAPWHAGENTVVVDGAWPNLRLAVAPAKPAEVTVAPAQRLAGIWYMREDPDHRALVERWPATLTGDTPPAGWVAQSPMNADALLRIADERPRWFAAPFYVSEAEARGPVRLLIDSPGWQVPTDLIKTLWVNGMPVSGASEHFSLLRHEQSRQKKLIVNFILSGLVKPGLNWLAFPVDFQDAHGVRMAVPAGMGWHFQRPFEGGWTLPLPKLDFSGHLDRVAWTAPYARLNSFELVRRDTALVPPANATVLARFSDGAPAVARIGALTFATVDATADWARFIGGSSVDWAPIALTSTYDAKIDYTFAQVQQPDPAQIIATLLRPAQSLTGTTIAPETEQATVRVAPANTPRLLNYRWRNWMGMLLAQGRVAVPAGADRLTLPAPEADPSPITTGMKREEFLRLALLDATGAEVLDYLDAHLDTRPPVDVLLAPTEQTLRDLPDRVPGSTSYDQKYLTWNLSTEGAPVPVVVPGERIQLRAMCRNTTATPQQVDLTLTWRGGLDAQPAPLRALHFTLAPFEQRTELLPCGFRVADMTFAALPADDPAPLRALPAGAPAGPALVSGQFTAQQGNRTVADLPLIAVRPWADTRAGENWPTDNAVAGPAGFGMFQFALTPSLQTVSDPKHVWWDHPDGGFFYSVYDDWRDNLVNTTGHGGGYGGFTGKRNFAWGAYDQLWEHTAGKAMPTPPRGTFGVPADQDIRAALDNSTFLPNGTRYAEWLFAGLTREYDRGGRGLKPLNMGVADYWGNFCWTLRERNAIHFLRWRRSQGQPLEVSTVAELGRLLKEDKQVAADWNRFAMQTKAGWAKDLQASMPAHSIINSQGFPPMWVFNPDQQDMSGVRAFLQAFNFGVLQPVNLSERGENRWGQFRAMNPEFMATDATWFYAIGHAQTRTDGTGECVFAAPEWARLTNLDYAFMGVKDDAGRVQPVVNVPLSRETMMGWGTIPIFGGRRDLIGSNPCDLLTREVTYHLYHLIQPEHLLGAYLVTTVERNNLDKFGKVNEGFTIADNHGLMSVLRNYGALWGGYLAPDRVSLLQPGEGVVYQMPGGAGAAEAESLINLVRKGGYANIFYSTGGTRKDETPLSDFFGVKYREPVKEADLRFLIGDNPRPYDSKLYGSLPYVAARPGNDLLKGAGALQDRVLLRTVEAGKGRALFSPLNADQAWGMDHDLARKLAAAVNWTAGNPVTLPDGVGGYGFTAQGMTFLALQDYKYTGGPATIRIKLPKGNYRAVDIFTGAPVPITAAGDEYLLRPTLSPNGGTLVMIR